MFAYEIFDNAGESCILSNADEVLANGWTRSSFPPIFLHETICWEFSNQEHRSYNYHIQSFDLIDYLLRAHSLSQDSKYLVHPIAIALDWIRHHAAPGSEGISPFAWYDMAVGMRAYRLAYLYEAAENAGMLSDEARELLWGSLEQHARNLEDDANIAFHSNHGYYQTAGQLAMGRRFAAVSARMYEALKLGQARLVTMLDQQFSPDGVHREHSPDYHRMVYDTLKGLINSQLVDCPEIIDRAVHIEKALSWFIFPSQYIVNFGDSECRTIYRTGSEAKRKWVTPEMRFLSSAGETGELPAESSRIFQDSGYWVVRTPSVPSAALPSYSYLALNAAFHSRTHKHADDLSFVWFDRGCNLLVDAGRYGYLGKTDSESELWLDGHWYSDPWRIYCESTRAHNALEFDGKNYLRKGVKPYGSALRRNGEDASGLRYVEAECKHFNSIRHVRMLFFMPGKWLVVFDWFHDNLENSHDVKQWFHLDHELSSILEDEQYKIQVPGSEEPLRVTSLLTQPRASRLYKGEHEPTLQGWWSPQERTVVPNYALSYDIENAKSGSYATVFSFSNVLKADHAYSKINVSGRKGQLRWKDDEGLHTLSFERPTDGPLSLTYKIRHV